MVKLLFEREVFLIQGAVFAVHCELGPGYLESVYQEALEYELRKRDIPYVSQKKLTVFYDGKPLNNRFRIDLLCFDEIVLELKTVKMFSAIHRAQIMNYLKAMDKRLGLLINFLSYPHVTIERVAL
jgi:GxxExxY protein